MRRSVGGCIADPTALAHSAARGFEPRRERARSYNACAWSSAVQGGSAATCMRGARAESSKIVQAAEKLCSGAR
jgi:hypothetical protein